MMKEDSEDRSSVDVGYVDETDSWKLESRFFPSKVGGRPAWLCLSELPAPGALACSKCQEPCILLCQVYAPIESRDDCFHRTLFVFMCRNAKCYSANDNSTFVVFRSQLTRKNDFYPFEPPENSENWAPDSRAEKWTDICAACGNVGTSHCGRCKQVKYCSRNHQVSHWKDHHKMTCNKDYAGNLHGKSSCLLPEFELIVEPEGEAKLSQDTKADETDSNDEGDDDDEAEKARLEEFESLTRQGKAGTLAGDATVDADLLSMAAAEDDKAFRAFKTRISQSPGQVLRYQRDANPLWLSEVHVPTEADISPCDYCGSKRVFEFQILPQLLNHLPLDNVDESIDWGVLAVYTCQNSCTKGPAYKKEFLWKQDVTH